MIKKVTITTITRRHFLIIIGCVFALSNIDIVYGQEIEQPKSDSAWLLIDSPTESSLRGLTLVDNKTAFASGSKGEVIASIDGGKTWTIVEKPGTDQFEIRDMHAFDANRVVAMNSGEPAKFFLSDDAGKSWSETFFERDKAAFFDAFEFWDNEKGIGFSDPIDGRLVVVRTDDGGKTWERNAKEYCPEFEEGEAGFAASGSCLAIHGTKKVWIGTGGKAGKTKVARVVYSMDAGKSWVSSDTPIPRTESKGIFSLAFPTDSFGVAVGGDYKAPEIAHDNIVLTNDGGKTWRTCKGKSPSGYRSVVSHFKRDGKLILVTSGRNGTDISLDNGENWKRISDVGFQAMSFSADGSSGIGVGRGGMIGTWRYQIKE